MTSKERWREVREIVFKEQGGQCATCFRKFASHEEMQAHHAIYTRQKGLEEWLDSPENIVLMCAKCHTANHGVLSSWFKRCCFWTDKIIAGYDMEKWHKDIPMLIKDQFVFIGKEED